MEDELRMGKIKWDSILEFNIPLTRTTHCFAHLYIHSCDCKHLGHLMVYLFNVNITSDVFFTFFMV